jgi:hypothetical protein
MHKRKSKVMFGVVAVLVALVVVATLTLFLGFGTPQSNEAIQPEQPEQTQVQEGVSASEGIELQTESTVTIDPSLLEELAAE